jgi:hypothetical protein
MADSRPPVKAYPEAGRATGSVIVTLVNSGFGHALSGPIPILSTAGQKIMRWISIVAMAIAIASNTAYAQDSTRADFEAFCAALEGRWIGDMVLVDDTEAFGKRGEKLTAFADVSVDEDGNSLVARIYGGPGTGTWILAFDAREKQIKSMWVNSGGDVDQATVIRDGEDWIEKGVGSTKDGETIEFENRLTISEAGSLHTWTGTSTRGGTAGDPRHDVWRRVNGRVPVAERADDFQDLASMFVGRWVGDVVFIHDWDGQEVGRGGKVTCYADYQSVADGKAIEAVNYNGTNKAKNIYFWDAANKKIVAFGFGTNGFSVRSIVDREGERSWRFRPVAGSTIDGERFGGSALCTFAEDGSEYRWTGVLTLADKPLDKLQDVYRRVR